MPPIQSAAVIPASAGFDAVSPKWDGDDITGLYCVAIIGWAVMVEWEVDRDGLATGETLISRKPVCLDHNAEVDAVRLPSGRVLFLDHEEVETEGAVVAEFKRLRDARIKRQKEAEKPKPGPVAKAPKAAPAAVQEALPAE